MSAIHANPWHAWGERVRALAGGSIFYLLSAVCILLGVAKVIVPMYEQIGLPPGQAIEKLFCLVALNLYELMLLGVALLILLWKNVVDDAVSLTLLIAVFLIGSGVALDTIAPDFPLAAVLFGLVGCVLAIAKLSAMARHITGPLRRGTYAALAILLAWNFLMPAALGFAQSAQMSNLSLVQIWFAGWWVTLIGAIVLIIDLSRIPHGFAGVGDAHQPLLRRQIMRWNVVGLLLVGTFVHQDALAWAFNLKLQVGDLLLALGALALLWLELRRAYGCRHTPGDVALGLVPLAAAITVIHAGSYDTTATATIGLIAYPPMALLAIALGYAALALRWESATYTAFTVAYATAGALFFGTHPASPTVLNVLAAGCVLALGLAIIGALARSMLPVVAAALVLALSTSFDPKAMHWHAAQRLEPWIVAMMLFGLLTQVIACVRPGGWRYALALAGSVMLSFGVWHCFGRHGSALHTPVSAALTGLALLVGMALVTWRTQHWWCMIPAIGPLVVALYQRLHAHVGWLLILCSFLVLALGAFASILKPAPPGNTKDGDDDDAASPAPPASLATSPRSTAPSMQSSRTHELGFDDAEWPATPI